MQTVSSRDNLHEMSYLFSGRNKKNISICRLLKILPKVQIDKELVNTEQFKTLSIINVIY